MAFKFNGTLLAFEVEEGNTRVISRLKGFQKNISYYVDALSNGDITHSNAILSEIQLSVISLNRELGKQDRIFTVFNIFDSDFMNEIIEQWIRFTLMYPMFWIHIKAGEYKDASMCLRKFVELRD